MLLTFLDKSYQFVLLLTLLCKLSSCALIGFNANYQYIYAGRFSIDINSNILSHKYGSNWQQVPMTITIPFGRASLNDNLDTISTMEDLQIKNLEQGIDIVTKDYNPSKALMYFDIQTKNASNIMKLKISYIYYPHRYVYDYPIAILAKDYYFSTTSSTFKHERQIKQLVNTAGGVEVIVFIKGMVIAPTSQLMTLDINATGYVDALTDLYLTIVCQSCAQGKQEMLRLGIFLYNPSLINSGQYLRVNVFPKIIFSNETAIFIDSKQQIMDFNTMVFLSAFSISNSSTFGYSTQIRNQTWIKFTPDSSFRSYSLIYVIYYTYYCDYKTRLFDKITNECWDVCPSPRKPDESLLICYSEDQPSLIALIAGVVVGSVILVLGIAIIIYVRRIRQKRLRMAEHRIAPRQAIFMPSPYLHRSGQPQNEVQQKYRQRLPHRQEHQRTTQGLQDGQMNQFKMKRKGHLEIVSRRESEKRINHHGQTISAVEYVQHTDIIQNEPRAKSCSSQAGKRQSQSMPITMEI